MNCDFVGALKECKDYSNTEAYFKYFNNAKGALLRYRLCLGLPPVKQQYSSIVYGYTLSPFYRTTEPKSACS